MNNIITLVLMNLEKVGIGIALFMGAYIANIGLGIWKNVKIEGYEFDGKLILQSLAKFAVLIISLGLLSVVISIIPAYATYIGIEIAEALKYIPAPAEEFIKEEKDEIKSQIIEVKPQEENKSENIIIPEEKQLDNKQEEVKEDVLENSKEGVDLEDTEEIKVDGIDEENTKEDSLIEEATKEIEQEENNNQEADSEEDIQNSAYFEETRFEVKPSLWQRINSLFIKTLFK